LIVTGNARKMSGSLIESVRRRRPRVVEKLKEHGAIDANYSYES
jgi:hypothetical protein